MPKEERFEPQSYFCVPSSEVEVSLAHAAWP